MTDEEVIIQIKDFAHQEFATVTAAFDSDLGIDRDALAAKITDYLATLGLKASLVMCDDTCNFPAVIKVNFVCVCVYVQFNSGNAYVITLDGGANGHVNFGFMDITNFKS